MPTSKIISILSGVLLGVVVLVGYGFAVGRWNVWPAERIEPLLKVVQSYRQYGEIVPENRRVRAPRGAARTRRVAHDADALNDGYHALLGWNDETKLYAVWLYDAAGTLVHEWQIDERTFLEDVHDNHNAPHPLHVMRDGSILISFDWAAGMARLDPCGEPIWTQRGHYHHSFAEAADGGIWTWYGRDTSYGEYQYAVKLDPETGRAVAKVGLIEDIINGGAGVPALFGMRPDTQYRQDHNDPRDWFHPNDVEELSPEMADAFPMFQAGDLLMSIRNLDMVLVADQEGAIKWMRQGPWIMQHDPDFRADGTISVFNNNTGRPRAEITIVDPATGAIRNHPIDPRAPFGTEFRGKHQWLPNGNVLITIPEQGQAIEVDPAGEVVLEFNNISAFDEAYNEDLVNAIWLPAGYFDTEPGCRTPS